MNSLWDNHFPILLHTKAKDVQYHRYETYTNFLTITFDSEELFGSNFWRVRTKTINFVPDSLRSEIRLLHDFRKKSCKSRNSEKLAWGWAGNGWAMPGVEEQWGEPYGPNPAPVLSTPLSISCQVVVAWQPQWESFHPLRKSRNFAHFPLFSGGNFR